MKQDINKKEEEEACQKILGRYHEILTLYRLKEGLFVSTKPILMKEGTKEEEEAYRKVLSPCRYYGLCCEVLIMCVCQWWFCSSLKHHKKQ